MIEIKKPRIECKDETVGRETVFTVEPLERGFGTTVGNSLRRILLSSLPGAAAVAIRIEGAQHEFQTLPGVKEEVMEIVLNIKGLAIKAHTEDRDFRQIMHIRKTVASGAPSYVVRAGDIEHSSDIEILNPDMLICTIDEGADLSMDIVVGVGRGYRSAEFNKDVEQPVGYIAVDSIFTPVERASYSVEAARVGQDINFDRLVLKVLTNGTATPREVMSLSAKILGELLGLFVGLVDNMSGRELLVSQDDEKQHKALEMSIDELDLSVRSYNCLKRAGINTVQDLVQKSEEDMLKVRNLGKKSLDEVLKKIKDLGFELTNKDE